MERDRQRAVHEDLCFGCGLSNPFGLQLDARADGPASVAGRFFVKQDHQGQRGIAHPGVLASALLEAVSLAGGRPSTAQLDVTGAAAVGTFVHVQATADHAVATTDSGAEVARVRCPRT